MIIKTFSRHDAEKAMQNYIKHGLSPVDEVFTRIRTDLVKLFEEIEELDLKDNYLVDVNYGIKLYDYLHSLGFNNRAASDTGFWRYLSVAVIPHVVEKRWPTTAIDHYWLKPSRIWLSSIWWYVHLSWQGNLDNTLNLLKSSTFSTDTILNLVERTGREGTNVKLYRRIMFYQSKVQKEQGKVFRAVMRLNTAKSIVIEPGLYPGGLDGYVKNLYDELNISFE